MAGINTYDLPVSSTDPPADAGGVQVYSKLNAGVAELFARSGNGTIVNLSSGGGMSIGGAVTGGTVGSTLFVGAGSLLAQDNTNYFWDNTNKRLGIGTNAPGTILDVAGAGNTAAIALRGGSAAAVSAASTGRFRYDQTTQKAQHSANGAAYLDIAMLATTLTTGSALFADTSGNIAQDNTNYFWDNTNKRLGIGTNAPGTILDIAGAGNTAAIALRGGSAAAVSAASTGRLRYDQTAQRAQFSANGAAYLNVALLAAALTTGSVLFADASGNIAQNNTAFSWTDAAKVLRITQSAADPGDGTGALTLRNSLNTSLVQITWMDNASVFKNALGYNNSSGRAYFYTAAGVTLEVNVNNGGTQHLFTSDGGFQLGASASAVSSASTGRARYTTTGQKWQLSSNAGAYVDIVQVASTGFTAGAVPFASNANTLTQNATNFNYDNVNVNLNLYTATAGQSPVYCRNTATTGVGGMGTIDNAGTFAGYYGFFGSAYAAVTAMQGKHGVLCFNNTNFVLGNSTVGQFEFGMTAGSAFFTALNGSSAAVSAANTGRYRYNTTGQKSQLSFNGAAYFDIATYAAALTSGSVPFANGSNQLAQDNTNFFFDSANSQLRVGASPALTSYALTTVKSIVGSSIIYVKNTAADGYSAIDYYSSGGTHQTALGYANATVAVTHIRSLVYWYSSGPNFVFANATKNEFTWGMTDGSTFMEMANGSGAAVSTANTGRLIYTTTGQKYQVSKNGAAYEDVATLATQQTFTKSQNVASVALTDAANIATNAANGNTFTVTLGGNRTLDNPTNLVAGGVYRWVISQDATGSRTLAYGALFKWPGGVAPVLTTTANAKDSITAIYDGAALLATFTLNYA